ncbi:hypothetical protein F4821DRAFT_258424 [Hypoxylon rubiginosum]|uniref:Uncharacterized protein n=1 Tax=Hypoxylon rubiginosum TaxID=110542 RepID=A0ACC0D5G3_9PEZI|nr:hypothetical protein F4821DRAFT_258424 [Hypoxylon rubiginosum]
MRGLCPIPTSLCPSAASGPPRQIPLRTLLALALEPAPGDRVERLYERLGHELNRFAGPHGGNISIVAAAALDVATELGHLPSQSNTATSKTNNEEFHTYKNDIHQLRSRARQGHGTNIEVRDSIYPKESRSVADISFDVCLRKHHSLLWKVAFFAFGQACAGTFAERMITCRTARLKLGLCGDAGSTGSAVKPTKRYPKPPPTISSNQGSQRIQQHSPADNLESLLTASLSSSLKDATIFKQSFLSLVRLAAHTLCKALRVTALTSSTTHCRRCPDDQKENTFEAVEFKAMLGRPSHPIAMDVSTLKIMHLQHFGRFTTQHPHQE